MLRYTPGCTFLYSIHRAHRWHNVECETNTELKITCIPIKLDPRCAALLMQLPASSWNWACTCLPANCGSARLVSSPRGFAAEAQVRSGVARVTSHQHGPMRACTYGEPHITTRRWSISLCGLKHALYIRLLHYFHGVKLELRVEVEATTSSATRVWPVRTQILPALSAESSQSVKPQLIWQQSHVCYIPGQKRSTVSINTTLKIYTPVPHKIICRWLSII